MHTYLSRRTSTIPPVTDAIRDIDNCVVNGRNWRAMVAMRNVKEQAKIAAISRRGISSWPLFHWHCRWQIARAPYNEVRDHSKHRLRRAISRLERNSVLLHSNQPTSASASERRWRRRCANQLHTLKSPWWHPPSPIVPSFRLLFLYLSSYIPLPSIAPILPCGTVSYLPSASPRGLANGPSAVLSDRFAPLQAEGRETSCERTQNEPGKSCPPKTFASDPSRLLHLTFLLPFLLSSARWAFSQRSVAYSLQLEMHFNYFVKFY